MVRRWAALSSADPDEAARNALRAFSGASLEDRRQIEGPARREIVWALVRLAWKQSSFHDAVLALALLAEAENETWANNASAEFVGRFQIYLGGTAVPYLTRLTVLDELLAKNRPSLASLVVKALAQAPDRDAIRFASDPASDELPEKEWQPRTNEEHFECVATAMNRLTHIAKLGITEIEGDLIGVAKDLSIMLRERPLQTLVASFLNAVRESYPKAREPLRRGIHEVIEHERKYWKTLSVEELEGLEQLHSVFKDSSLGSRLQQHVAQAPLDREEQTDLIPLAEELASDSSALAEHWPWLTSGDASDAWRLGLALAAVDQEGYLAEKLPVMPGSGRDLRLVCGYISARRQALGDEWYDGWMASQSKRDPIPLVLLFEVAWRCGATSSVALMLEEVISNEPVSPEIVGRLGFGRWGENLPADVLERVLRAMAQTGHPDTAIAILMNRMKSSPDEASRWKPLGLELVTDPSNIRSRQMTNYYWKEVAGTLVGEYARDIAEAILRGHQNQDSGTTWLLAYSEAAKVLGLCVEKDPTGVWRAIQPYLSSRLEAERFSIGFPRDVFDRIPPDDIGGWMADQPEDRAIIVAKLSSGDVSNDQTLASIVLGQFGENEMVSDAFFSKYISGTWRGPASSRWSQLAHSLDEVAGRTDLVKLRRWAQKYAGVLRRMEEDARRREEEEELHRR